MNRYRICTIARNIRDSSFTSEVILEALFSLFLCGGLLFLLGFVVFAALRNYTATPNVPLLLSPPAPVAPRQPSHVDMRAIDQMTGTMFERCLADVFAQHGYRVEHTGRLGDYGADLVVMRDDQRAVVQAKRWIRQVGVRAVQEAVAAKGIYRCTHAIVVTNSTFTFQARRLAQANGVELWDRTHLIRMLQTRPAPPVLPVRAIPQPADPTAFVVKPIAPAPPLVACCATCGIPVSDNVRQYCLDHAQRFNGTILCYKHQRYTVDPS